MPFHRAYAQFLGRYRLPLMEFSSDLEMKKIPELADEFYEHILDDPPFFVSDEATIYSVSGAETDKLLARISNHYRTVVSESDLKQPLWKLIRQLNEGRGAAPCR
jgi:hypothetical protein